MVSAVLGSRNGGVEIHGNYARQMTSKASGIGVAASQPKFLKLGDADLRKVSLGSLTASHLFKTRFNFPPFVLLTTVHRQIGHDETSTSIETPYQRRIPHVFGKR
jgi:hypothetical protein